METMKGEQVIDLRERMDGTQSRIRATINGLCNHYRLTDQAIASIIDESRQTVQNWRKGPKKLSAENIAAFAWALGVPDEVLLVMEWDEALRWVLDASHTLPERSLPWITVTSPIAA